MKTVNVPGNSSGDWDDVRTSVTTVRQQQQQQQHASCTTNTRNIHYYFLPEKTLKTKKYYSSTLRYFKNINHIFLRCIIINQKPVKSSSQTPYYWRSISDLWPFTWLEECVTILKEIKNLEQGCPIYCQWTKTGTLGVSWKQTGKKMTFHYL